MNWEVVKRPSWNKLLEVKAPLCSAFPTKWNSPPFGIKKSLKVAPKL